VKAWHMDFKLRLFLVVSFLVLGYILLGLRLAQVQLLQGPELAERAVAVRTKDRTVPAARGAVFDRNGKELAINLACEDVYAMPRDVKKYGTAEESAELLAPILGIEKTRLLAQLSSDQKHEWLLRKLTAEQAEAFKQLKYKERKLKGIYIEERMQRFYPNGRLACHVLGFTGVDNQGLEGLELSCDKILKGQPGKLVAEYDAQGREIPETVSSFIPPEAGKDIRLTLDLNIQHLVEKNLDQLYENHKPNRASIIVMDTNSGEILALGNRPGFDPNNFAVASIDERRNAAVCNAYELGSIFKIITAAAALEERIIAPGSACFCSGELTVDKRTMHCSHNRAHGQQTFSEAMANSCNVVLGTIGLRLGMEKFYHYLQLFGLGQKTGIELPGESAGIIVDQGRARSIDLASMSIGQANAFTPLQLLSALCIIANGGRQIKPHAILAVGDGPAAAPGENGADPAVRVISEETSNSLRAILEEVVIDGTGKSAAIAGYRVAGKTGTAQKVGAKGTYLANSFVASFIGFAPVENPRVAVIVVVDAPQGDAYYGGLVAAPYFRNILFETLRYLQVPYSYQPETEGMLDLTNKSKDSVQIPDAVNQEVSAAERLVKDKGLIPVFEGEGDRVWAQIPQPLSLTTRGSKIILYTASADNQKGADQEVVVPDLLNRTIRDAGVVLGSIRLRMEPQGTGCAVSQIPKAGTKVAAGTIVKVWFEPPCAQQ